MRIGYARVSTQEQDNAAQIAALRAAGCGRIFEEKVSAGRWDRPELRRLLDQLREGDVLVVWKLDRLSRSLKGFQAGTAENSVVGFQAGTAENSVVCDRDPPAGRLTTDATVESLAAV